MDEYANWLKLQDYQENTIATQLYRIGRVQQCHGDLDDHYAKDRMVQLLGFFVYTANDEANNSNNPSLIPFIGNIRSNIASYRGAITRFLRYKNETQNGQHLNNRNLGEPILENLPDVGVDKQLKEQEYGEFEFEKSMQIEIRKNIALLQADLEIIDNGQERSVDSGRIDITAQIKGSNNIVVIELKRGRAGQRAIAQILSYMGDIVIEEPTKQVSGILIASEFDDKAKAAARVIPTLKLISYAVLFKFETISTS